ncbi:probable leucine--tRNA ligase, mitochondrial [Stegodyphus dumicola]|uniref:probable leucine--tRNA ligase, mitochondrial n=1 Tax=Stegodyphus dumicola TaxID=202533 RepID=UPI0015AB03BD|nr:probable leucine--tRNA ligase, mitochondrial [Stegodyphus dumicola]
MNKISYITFTLTARHFLVRPMKHFPNLVYVRTIFSLNKCWDQELTNDVKKDIEKHWRDKINMSYHTEKDAQKYYLLSMFPYPSGNLHMGHVRVYTLSDAIAHFFRLNGRKVIHPIGWDAFGLPAENAAIEKNVNPFEWTENNISVMKKQLKDLNISFDWDMELATSDPCYYKWTQHLFLLMYEQGLAYKKEAAVNWDPVDQTVLADEQVDENGFSWRSGCKVEKRRLSQWFLRTSAFSKDLYEGLKDPSLIEWRDVTKVQKHWIGEPDGFIFHLNLSFNDEALNDSLTVWTSTPELIYGASFVVISPDNHFNAKDYGGGHSSAKDFQLNIFAIHPFTGKKLPIYVTTNLESSPTTDSCLGIPVAENKSHIEFALKHNIDITEVFDYSSNELINSNEFSGLDRKSAGLAILDKAKTQSIKVYQASKKLREDWFGISGNNTYCKLAISITNLAAVMFSHQTYQLVPVPKEDLPVLLPKLTEFTGKGCSLKSATEWVEVSCPKCGQPAARETDTMDTFVDSSWYFLRYLDVKNESEPYDLKTVSDAMPVDLYIGGKEHAALHLFYARFLCHFLYSIGKLKHPEPFVQLLMQGMVMGKSYRVKGSGKYIPKEEVDFSGSIPTEKSSGTPVIETWEKMSKSKHNGINPQEVIDEHGIDTTRLFILGSVAPESPRKWNDDLFAGIQNWQWRLWLTMADFLEQRKLKNLQSSLSEVEIKNYEVKLNKARNFYIKGVTHNIINTKQLSVAIAKLQGLTGELRRIPKVMAQSEAFEKTFGTLLIMLAPLAPHFASELWTAFCSVALGGQKCSFDLNKPVLLQKWPEFDENCEMEIHIKLNGDECDSIILPRKELLSLSEEKAIDLALSRQKVLDVLNGAKVKHARYKKWPNYDSDVFIVYIPQKKAKKPAKLTKAVKSA